MRKKSEENNLHKKMNKEQGFTVAELLVVVAIISILSMISIPLFAAKLEETKRTTCLYNCQTMARLLRTETQLGTLDENTVKAVIHSMGIKSEEITATAIVGKSMLYSCPGLCKEGTYMISDAGDGEQIYYVKCTKHGMTAPNFLNTYPEDSLSALVSLDKFKTYFTTKTSPLDSTGPNWGIPIKKELARMLNITVDFDFYIYKYPNENKYKIYISDPLGEYGDDKKTEDEEQEAINKKGIIKVQKYEIELDKNWKIINENIISEETEVKLTTRPVYDPTINDYKYFYKMYMDDETGDPVPVSSNNQN